VPLAAKLFRGALSMTCQLQGHPVHVKHDAKMDHGQSTGKNKKLKLGQKT